MSWFCLTFQSKRCQIEAKTAKSAQFIARLRGLDPGGELVISEPQDGPDPGFPTFKLCSKAEMGKRNRVTK